MSAHTRHPIKTEAVEHTLGTPHYNPYGPQPIATRPWKEKVLPESDDHFPPHSVITAQSKRSLYEGFADFYWSVSWVAGFKEKFSLILCSYKSLLLFYSLTYFVALQ